MARMPILVVPGYPHRVTQRGARRMKTFFQMAQRLKRVFNIDIETCSECGGAIKVIASIEDPVVIQKIL